MVIKEYDVNELSIGFSRYKSSSTNISCSTSHINIGICVKINLNHHHISIIVDVKGLGGDLPQRIREIISIFDKTIRFLRA